MLLDFTDHLLQAIGSEKRIADVTQWDIFALIEEWHGPARRDLAMLTLREARWWRNQPPLTGSMAAVAALREAGHEIVVATSPWYSCFEWDCTRRDVLKAIFGIPRENIVTCARKELIAGDALVDDRPEHVTAWAQANPNGFAFLYDAPYNHESDLKPRISWTSTRRPGVFDTRTLIASV